VNTPSADLSWIFTQPGRIATELDPQEASETCVARMTGYLNALADRVINFFFVPPADGLRSRGEGARGTGEIQPQGVLKRDYSAAEVAAGDDRVNGRCSSLSGEWRFFCPIDTLT
jgi:hypothetical protein